MSIPILRPPSIEEAQKNAEGNRTTSDSILKIAGQTLSDLWKTMTGVPRFLAVDLPLEAAATTIDFVSNAVGMLPIVGYRVAKYIRDARGGMQKILAGNWMKRGGGHAALAGAH